MTKFTAAQWKQIQIERRASIIREVCPNKNMFTDIIPFLFTMAKYERQLQRLAVLSCNGYPMPKTEYRDGKYYQYNVEDVKLRERCEKKEARIERLVVILAASFNMAVEFQGDPRGLMFSLKTSDGRIVEVA